MRWKIKQKNQINSLLEKEKESGKNEGKTMKNHKNRGITKTKDK